VDKNIFLWLVCHLQTILNRYNLTYNEDGTFTAYFGNCPEGTPNYAMTAEGWNVLLRLYGPLRASRKTDVRAARLPHRC
jgi:hypothetical protein